LVDLQELVWPVDRETITPVCAQATLRRGHYVARSVMDCLLHGYRSHLRNAAVHQVRSDEGPGTAGRLTADAGRPSSPLVAADYYRLHSLALVRPLAGEVRAEDLGRSRVTRRCQVRQRRDDAHFELLQLRPQPVVKGLVQA